jgi:hypothetical protein
MSNLEHAICVVCDPALSVLQRPSDPISAVVPMVDPVSVPAQWRDHNTSLVADMIFHLGRPTDPAPPRLVHQTLGNVKR